MNRKFLSLIIILLSLCGCKANKDTVVFSNVKEVELGSEFDSCNLIESINNEVITSSMIANNSIYVNGKRMTCSKIDASVLGEQSVLFNIDKQLFETTIKVVDTEAPKVEVEDVETDLNKKIDLLENVKTSDNDEIVETLIQGDYDFSKAGTYNLKAVAKDASGNVGETEFTLTVKEKVKKNTSTNNTSTNTNKGNSNNNTQTSDNNSNSANVAPTEPSNSSSSSSEQTKTDTNSGENSGGVSNTCLGGSVHAEAEQASDLSETARNLLVGNNCSNVSIESDGTQYGWNIVCSCN